MPELPYVETFRRFMDEVALDRPVVRTQVPDPDLLEEVSERTLQRRLKGERFETTRRHGKYLFAETSGGDWLVLHFGMTGFLAHTRNDEDTPDHVRVLFHFRDGDRLAFDCQRKFGAVSLTEHPDAFVERKGLGPDALSLDLSDFRALLEDRRGRVKSALMDQSLMAGVGNVYSDEALYHARVDPRVRVGDLDASRVRRLYRSLHRVLDRAIQAGSQPEEMPRGWLLHRREEGATCPKCGEAIRRIVVSGRGAYWCPGHQAA